MTEPSTNVQAAVRFAVDEVRPKALLDELRLLRAQVYEEGQALFEQWRPQIERRPFLISALNLAYYLALRRRDLRALQTALTPLGLSSLGRSEARVLPNLDAVIATLSAVCRESGPAHVHPSLRAFYRGQRMLERNAAAALGPAPDPRRVRIMVTLPTEAADDYSFVRDLLRRGMNDVRINCAHDNESIWALMIEHVHRAQAETEQPCKILMDLGGPKARTGQVLTPPDEKRLKTGDHLLLTAAAPNQATEYPFQAECLIPDVLPQLKVGDSVWIDDGRLGAQIESILDKGLLLRVTHAPPKGRKLASGKGLNFPDTDLQIAPLTDKDREDLAFATIHADAIGYSFVQSAADVALLHQAISERLATRSDLQPLAIIAKIETRRAVQNLPEIIIQAAGKQPFGVMIARGDLAVEIGYQRMAEMQEEMLWICEAAHVPVIWATQVLESFVKKGIPTRAEMTDAAMAERAECVMLNKGPFAAQAVTILNDVLTRMQDHQLKKTPQLRALQSWQPNDLTVP